MLSFRDALQIISDYWNLPRDQFKWLWRGKVPDAALNEDLFNKDWQTFLEKTVDPPTGVRLQVQVFLKKKGGP